MSKINPQRFLVEDFQSEKDWIGNLLSNLNSFIEETVSAFTNNMTIKDNLYQEIKEIKFSNQTNNFPLKFQTKFKANPQGVLMIYCYNNTDNSVQTTAPWPIWSYANNEIKIADIDGLVLGKTYTIRLLVIYG